PDVVVVDACRHHADDHLERAGLGDLDLLDLERVLGLAETLLTDDPRRHRLRQLAGLCADVGYGLQIDRHVLWTSLLGGVPTRDPTRVRPPRAGPGASGADALRRRAARG